MNLLLVTAIYLMLGSIAAGQFCSAPVANIPVFQDQRDNPEQNDRIPLPLDRIQVVIPAYTFTCHGRVVQWGACVERGGGGERYDIDFQVLRPSPVSNPGVDCYSLVGSNFVNRGQPVDRCIVYDVPVEEQFLVQPGDVVGFFSDNTNRNDNRDGVQVVEDGQDVVVHYRELDTIPATDPESCMFVVGPGQIDSTTTGAPVITAIVELVTPTISQVVTLSPAALPFTSVVPSQAPPGVVPSPGVASSIIPPVNVIGGASLPVVQTPSPTANQPPSPPNTGAPPSGGIGTMAIIGVVIGLLLGIIILLVLLVIVSAVRIRRRSREKFSPQPQNGIVNPNYESGPAKRKFKGVSPSSTSNYQAIRNSASGLAHADDYTYPLSMKSNVPSDSAYTYISTGSELSTRQQYADPRQGQPMTTAGLYHMLDSHPSETQYADPGPTSPSYRTQDLDHETFDSAGIYVPTEEQRIAAGNHYEMLENNEYNKLKFFVDNQTYWAPASSTSDLYSQLAAKKYREIPRQQIMLGDKLGSGQFGQVCKGQWRFSGASLEAAVKTLKTDAPEVEKVRFLQEAAIMGQFSHANIVRLYGVVTMGEPTMIVLELMPNGDLRSYLKKLEWEDESEVQRQFLRFAREIAAGMVYLSGKSFVHRDLAARNILLDQELNCKIGDFGLARDLVDDTYYKSRGGQIPVKWTAPEALLYKKYSVSSDVWSYAMVLFEIWSVGRKPFQNLSNTDVIALVHTGHCQPPAPGCPRKVYRLMVDCWNPAHHERPTFVGVSDYLRQPDRQLLAWEEGVSSSKKARELGAPISESRHLYLDLQHKYI